jgi:cytoskeletal protein CcmA (bactofilin family)
MKKSKKIDSFSTYLGPDAAIEGTIEFNGTIQLDGKVNGKIQSSGGTVIVGEKAVIHADVSVGIAIIMGELNGTVHASEKISLKPPARVVGDIQAPEISIEERVVFNGNCAMEAHTIKSSKPTETPKKKTAPSQVVTK